MGLEDIANVVSGLTSAAQGYMTGQQFVMQIQKQKDDADAQKITNILRQKQIELETAKLDAENMKLPFEIDKLRSEAEKNRRADTKAEDKTKMFNWDVLKNLDDQNMSPLMKGYKQHGITNNLTGDFVVPDIMKNDLENYYKMNADALKRAQELADKTKEVGSKLTAEAGKVPLEALKTFRADKSVSKAIETLDRIKVGLADYIDEKGKFRTYENRIKADDKKKVLGSVGMMSRLLAQVSDPNSAVRDLEEANMASKGAPILDKIRNIIASKFTGDVTKEEYDMMSFLVSKYVKGNVDIIENTAKAMAPSLQAQSKALKDAGSYYPGSNVKARALTYDDIINSVPSLNFLKNASLPTAAKEINQNKKTTSIPIPKTGRQSVTPQATQATSDKVRVTVDGKETVMSRKLYEANKGSGRIKLVGPR